MGSLPESAVFKVDGRGNSTCVHIVDRSVCPNCHFQDSSDDLRLLALIQAADYADGAQRVVAQITNGGMVPRPLLDKVWLPARHFAQAIQQLQRR